MLAAAQRSLPGLARGEVAPPPDTRVRHLTVALGATGMGKSWLARKALEEWKENNPTAPIYQIGKGHIWVAGAGTDKQLLFPEVIALTNNGMGPSAVRMNPRIPLEGGYVMLDDGDAAIPKTIADTPWYEFCWEHRHLRIDGWLNAHRPQRIDNRVDQRRRAANRTGFARASAPDHQAKADRVHGWLFSTFPRMFTANRPDFSTLRTAASRGS